MFRSFILIQDKIRSSIRNRVLAYFLILALLPTFAIGAVAYAISVNVTTSITEQGMSDLVDRIGDESDKLLAEALDLADMVANDPSIQQIIRVPLPEDISRRYAETLTLNSRLNFTQQYRDKIFGIYVIGKYGGVYKSTYHSERQTNLRETWWYKDIQNRMEPVWFVPHVDSFAVLTTGDRLITVGLPIIDKADGSFIGAVLVEIAEQDLQQIFTARLINGGEVLLLNSQLEILVYPRQVNQPSQQMEYTDLLRPAVEQIEGGEISGEMKGLISASGSSPLYVYRLSAVNDWTSVGIIPGSVLSRSSNLIARVILITLLLMIVISIFFAFRFTQNVAGPIQTLRRRMLEVEKGNFNTRVIITSSDELGQLAKSFNRMIEEIDQLIKREVEYQTDLRKSEQRALQAQINPHFLYNTLDSINWMARGSDAASVEKMISALTSFYRIGLSRGKDIIALGDELRHVESYLTIQIMNYAFDLTYTIDVPAEMKQMQTVKLILQPIVENAIYHGIKQRDEKGHVDITGRLENQNMVLEVTDNGVGMTESEVNALNNSIGSGKPEETDTYGVLNVHKRINIYFGDQYGLFFRSQKGTGTTVTITLPAHPL